MGMLRSGNESELVKTLDYHAEGGTIQVNGQACALTKYRVQANYQIPGYRTQIECSLPNKQTYKNVETMSGDYAWDEDIPGAELVPGKGKATPKPEALEERRIRLWASPHGAPKAAIAGAAGLPPDDLLLRLQKLSPTLGFASENREWAREWLADPFTQDALLVQQCVVRMLFALRAMAESRAEELTQS